MATKPDLIKWVADDDSSEIIDPGSTKKANGWDYKEKPAFQFLNYIFNRYFKWLRGLQGGYANIVVGSSSQVTASDATHTVGQLNDSVVGQGARVLFLEGTHTLGANLTLSNANVVFDSENSNALVDLASTYKLTLSGNGCRATLAFANVTNASDAVSVTGTRSRAVLENIAIANVTAADSAQIHALGATAAFKMNGSAVGPPKGSDVASASTLQIGQTGQFFHVTGAVTVTGISARAAGERVTFYFASALAVTYNGTSMILQGGVDLAVPAGATVDFVSEGSGNWRQAGSAAGLKPNVKDHGTKSSAYTLYLDEADMHLVAFSASATLTIASRLTNDRAMVVVKNNNYTVSLAGIDNNPPTLTAAASTQDFLALAKTFGKVSCLSSALNKPTA